MVPGLRSDASSPAAYRPGHGQGRGNPMNTEDHLISGSNHFSSGGSAALCGVASGALGSRGGEVGSAVRDEREEKSEKEFGTSLNAAAVIQSTCCAPGGDSHAHGHTDTEAPGGMRDP
ncbi:unnamed protein product [Pleuronectes platessa]|uniref:Uncharacterized protein n=1 Tax=Pleuronectes platessa TaxID=8262 RepID=A0A9N7YCF4_PLEPL|nr:unnamed protein product [Pleuronectes platessa]